MPRRNRNAGPREGDLLVLGDGSIQDDLFGAVEAELDRRAQAERVRVEFEARTTRMPDGSLVLWTAPYAFPGVRAGHRVPGLRCWLCGDIEPNAYVLDVNHALTVDDPGCLDRTSCTRQRPGAAAWSAVATRPGGVAGAGQAPPAAVRRGGGRR